MDWIGLDWTGLDWTESSASESEQTNSPLLYDEPVYLEYTRPPSHCILDTNIGLSSPHRMHASRTQPTPLLSSLSPSITPPFCQQRPHRLSSSLRPRLRERTPAPILLDPESYRLDLDARTWCLAWVKISSPCESWRREFICLHRTSESNYRSLDALRDARKRRQPSLPLSMI